MSNIVETQDLTKQYGSVTAVNEVSITVAENTITGLLGRNGAGKTTLMSLLTGQEFASSGEIRVFGANPVENASVLRNVCFIKESQKYPDEFRPKDVFKTGPWFFEHWNTALAERLVNDFRLPLNRKIKKLSRGQQSAVGVIVGLASRAPLTFFDEPYLGLDAVARQKFYDILLADYAEHPRTVILSTHLIDEVSNLLEHVIVIDNGRIIVDQDADSLRGTATTLVGTAKAVDAFVGTRPILHRDAIGGLASVSVAGLNPDEKRQATAAGIELAPVSLQQLVVRMTETNENEFKESA